MNRTRYKDRLSKNIIKLNETFGQEDRISTVGKADPAAINPTYPNLSRMLLAYNGSLFRKLLAVLNYFYEQTDSKTAQRAEYSHYRKRYEIMLSQETMTQLKAGTSPNSWRAAMTKLCAMGLIEKQRVSENVKYWESNTEQQKESLMRAAEKTQNENRKFRPVMYWHVPRYTKKLFKEADKVAAQIKPMGNGISKDTLRDTFGSDAANMIDSSSWQEHSDITRLKEFQRLIIEEMIEARGYIYPQEVINFSVGRLWETDTAQDEWRLKRLYSRAEAVWRGNVSQYCNEMGLKYGRPTKADIEKYHLQGRFYILKKNNDTTR